MNTTLLIIGIVFLAAAIVGGGLKVFGVEVQPFGSGRRQVLLAAVGVFALVVAYAAPRLAPATTTAPLPAQSTVPISPQSLPATASAAPSSTAAPPPEQTWTQAWSQVKQITMPGSGSFWYADLDTPEVSQSASGWDLRYWNNGLSATTSVLMGLGPDTLPAPDNCFSAAQSSPADQPYQATQMTPGKTSLCVVTNQGNLVWLHLLSGGGVDAPSYATLTFELMEWRKSG